MPDWITLADCRVPEDLLRLEPHEYARLAATSASMLDVFEVKLEIRRVLEDWGRDLERASKAQ